LKIFKPSINLLAPPSKIPLCPPLLKGDKRGLLLCFVNDIKPIFILLPFGEKAMEKILRYEMENRYQKETSFSALRLTLTGMSRKSIKVINSIEVISSISISRIRLRNIIFFKSPFFNLPVGRQEGETFPSIKRG
jgi:hypothetical protein